MEVVRDKAVWPDPSHPNYERWRRGRNLSEKRAEIVRSIISADLHCKNLKILDLGSGEGGTSSLLADSNDVISYDLSLLRLRGQQKSYKSYHLINGNGDHLPFRNSVFDLIILQDVIEHIRNRQSLIMELSRVLKKGGVIYLSTPNKLSLLNIISDPHWGIPFLSIFKRPAIKKYFLDFIRKNDADRNDIAELLSLKEITELLRDYRLSLKTREIAQLISVNPDGILWSSFHLSLYNLLSRSGLLFIMGKIANNRSGFINKYLTPTYYILLTGKEL